MRILIPSTDTSNPFIFQIISSLQHASGVTVVQHGLKWLEDRRFKFDIILFQWPEVLLGWEPPSEKNLKELNDTIKYWKQSGASLVATIHNLVPHENNRNAKSRKLYEIVYKNCDALVHMGEASIKLFNETYPGFAPRREEIISHGNYNYFTNNQTQEDARNKLGISLNEFVVLIFGAIRSSKEVELIIETANYINKNSGKILLVSNLPNRDKKKLSYYLFRLPIWLKSNIMLKDGYVPDSDVQIYLNAADVLLIPRLKSLNSGNVALGYTFGKVVVGPDFGVIGEDLKKLGNPVFNVDLLPDSLKKSINISRNLLDTKLGKKNKYYSESIMDWNNIAEQYVNLFKVLVTK